MHRSRLMGLRSFRVTATPMGNMVFTVMESLAQMERDIKLERMNDSTQSVEPLDAISEAASLKTQRAR